MIQNGTQNETDKRYTNCASNELLLLWNWRNTKNVEYIIEESN